MGTFYITGASGFIGSALAAHLGDGAISVSRAPCPAGGLQINDYTDTRWMAAKDTDATILHCAGDANPRRTRPDNPTQPTDALPHAHMIEALAARGWRGRLVNLSTAALYGNSDTLPIPETHAPSPVSPYGAHKLDLERRFETLAHIHGFDLVNLRISNPYGGTVIRDNRGVIPMLIRAARQKTPFRLLGNGRVLRDYIAMPDLCRAIARSAEVPIDDNVLTLNIGSGTGTRLLDLIALVERLSGQRIALDRAPARQEAGDSVLDISTARQRLGWAPEIPLEVGIYNLLQAGI